MRYLVAYLCSGFAFLALDLMWLTFANKAFYRPLIGPVLADKVSLPPAVAFYFIYLGGILFFAVAPALRLGSAGKAALAGAVLGLVAYATYDLTNQATLKVWSVKVTAADLAWGVFVTTAAALAGYWGGRLIKG